MGYRSEWPPVPAGLGRRYAADLSERAETPTIVADDRCHRRPFDAAPRIDLWWLSTKWLVEGGTVVASKRGRPHPDPDRRQALVVAAFRRIAEKGFEGLRLRDVASHVGIDHSTLHHYFPTKRDLVASVVEYATRQFWPTMAVDGDPLDRLRRHLGELGRMVRERPELFTVLAELDLRARRDPAVRAVIVAHEEGWRTVLADALRCGAEEGGWAAGTDVATTVELVIATVKGVGLMPDQAEDVLGRLAAFLATQHTPGPPAGPDKPDEPG